MTFHILECQVFDDLLVHKYPAAIRPQALQNLGQLRAELLNAGLGYNSDLHEPAAFRV